MKEEEEISTKVTVIKHINKVIPIMEPMGLSDLLILTIRESPH
jgi:hypothetical protein